MKTYLYFQTVVYACAMCLSLSCNRSEGPVEEPDPPNASTYRSLYVNVTTEEFRPVGDVSQARAHQFSGALTPAQEDAINNIVYFEFDSMGAMRNAGFISREQGTLDDLRSVQLRALNGVPGNTVFLVANLDNFLFMGADQIKLNDLQYLFFPMDKIMAGNDLPMTGVIKIGNSLKGLRVELTRRVARMNVTVDASHLPAGHSFTLDKMQLINVATELSLVSQGETDSSLLGNTNAVSNNNHTWYIPESHVSNGAEQNVLRISGRYDKGEIVTKDFPLNSITANSEYYFHIAVEPIE